MEFFTKHASDGVLEATNAVTVHGKSMLKEPALSTRKCRIGKSISPGSEKGRLEITLLYRNKANFLRENVVINEFVPANFSIVGSNSHFGTMPRDGGTLVSWLLDKADPDEEVEINYSIKADSDSSSLKNLDCKAFK
nr:hypothetical protein [Candidatus Sigynarchaeum springense]MDO8116520.1 hypothetical protein [Candidatus Sigynarchaeota archaeon]